MSGAPCIAALRVEFMLHGCRSLKEKRQRLGKLRDKFGKHTALAVCESDFADNPNRAEWTFVAVSSNATVVEKTLQEVESYVGYELDAVVCDVERRWLA